jgi:hypothetical protein
MFETALCYIELPQHAALASSAAPLAL